MIDEKRLSQALTYMAETDEKSADLHASMERAEYKAKAVRDAIFLHSEGTVAERTAKAGASDEYLVAMNLYFDMVEEFHAIRNKRQTETLIVDVWRSLNSARSKGIL